MSKKKKNMRLDTFTKAESSYRGGAEQGRCRGDEGDTRAARKEEGMSGSKCTIFPVRPSR